jgi:hypothetical protein
MIEYRVSINELSDPPVVGPTGNMTHTVVYHIESLDGALSEDWNGGVVQGEALSRCLHLQEKGSVTVAQPASWEDHRPDKWQESIVNLALDHSISESA